MPTDSSAETYTCYGLIAIESSQPLPSTLTKQQADQIGSQIAQELSKVLRFGDIKEVSLAMAAALYPSEALLTPGFTLHNNILKYASAAFQGEQNQHRVLSIGAHQGQMPEGLQPITSQSPLLHLPFVLITTNADLADRFEGQLLDKGMISPPTYQLINKLFGSAPIHANYMSHLDLIAMMHNHYNQVGMHHLWQIIETAILAKNPQYLWHSGAENTHITQAMYLFNNTVYMPFISGTDFQKLNESSNVSGYIHYLMAQRLAAEVFRSHGLKTQFVAFDQSFADADNLTEDNIKQLTIKQPYFHHSLMTDDKVESPKLIDWHHPKAGYVWSSLHLCDGRHHVFYPLQSDAVSSIDQLLEKDYSDIMAQAEKQKRILSADQEDLAACL